MAIEIGVCCRGRITRITPWGAFAVLEQSGDAVSGMIHISELSSAYVREVSDCVNVGDEVVVKVLSVDDRGRIALSRKQAMTAEEQAAERAQWQPARNRTKNRMEQTDRKTSDANAVPIEYTPYVRKERSQKTAADETDFETMLRSFQTASEEKLGALRRSADGHRARRKR